MAPLFAWPAGELEPTFTPLITVLSCSLRRPLSKQARRSRKACSDTARKPGRSCCGGPVRRQLPPHLPEVCRPAGQTAAAAPLATKALNATRKHAPDISFPVGAHNTAELDCWASSNYANVFVEGSGRRNGRSRRGALLARARNEAIPKRKREGGANGTNKPGRQPTAPACPDRRTCSPSRDGLFARRGPYTGILRRPPILWKNDALHTDRETRPRGEETSSTVREDHSAGTFLTG